MTGAYTADGRRRSSMAHARRRRECNICGDLTSGNGGRVSHGRKHVRNGEAVELVKEYPTRPPGTTRLFLKPDDETVGNLLERGYTMRNGEV